MQTEQDSQDSTAAEAVVEIRNAQGLHMRPAMQFVDVASRYGCEVTVKNDHDEVDGKSIMEMSMLAATCGTRLTIRASGPGARDAIAALKELVEDRMFDEPPPKEVAC